MAPRLHPHDPQNANFKDLTPKFTKRSIKRIFRLPDGLTDLNASSNPNDLNNKKNQINQKDQFVEC